MRFRLPAYISIVALAAAVALPAMAPTAGSAASKRTVTSELRVLRDSGAITPQTYAQYASAYNSAKATAKGLRGNPRTQLTAVIKNVEYLASKRQLVTGRLPVVFLTLTRNAEWWSSGRSIASGARTSFTGSELVWQYYAGQGMQIQWLGTFGKANGYLKAKNVQNTKLKLLLDEAVALTSQRAGGVGWEYQFEFGGGKPPWVSAMAQATGIQALARAGVKYATSDPTRSATYLNAARSALPIFNTPTPEGVRVNTTVGAHYVLYSYSRGLRVQNAFTQTISALHDYVELTGDPVALAAFLQGEAQLRAETPTYDTGAWSLYTSGSESSLNYHNESTTFLGTLCQSLLDDQTAAAAGGGVAPGGIPPLDATVYCDAATRYKTYLATPPVVTLDASKLRKGRLSPLRFTLSKISKVSITARRSGAVIYQRTLTIGGGKRFVKFKPSKTGAVDVTMIVTDLAGNRAMATGVATVSK